MTDQPWTAQIDNYVGDKAALIEFLSRLINACPCERVQFKGVVSGKDVSQPSAKAVISIPGLKPEAESVPRKGE